MQIEDIRTKLGQRDARPLGVEANFAVLVPLIEVEGTYHVLYEVRSRHLNTQPGEISFPGGRVEQGESFVEAALRETVEELNINLDRIKIIGQLDYIVMPFNMAIYPFVGIIEGVNKEDIHYSRDEVASIFTVPLKDFLETEPDVHYMDITPQAGENFPYHRIQNGKAYNWRSGKYPVYFYDYKDYVIWGITARITKNCVALLKED